MIESDKDLCSDVWGKKDLSTGVLYLWLRLSKMLALWISGLGEQPHNERRNRGHCYVNPHAMDKKAEVNGRGHNKLDEPRPIFDFKQTFK